MIKSLTLLHRQQPIISIRINHCSIMKIRHSNEDASNEIIFYLYTMHIRMRRQIKAGLTDRKFVKMCKTVLKSARMIAAARGDKYKVLTL